MLRRLISLCLLVSVWSATSTLLITDPSAASWTDPSGGNPVCSSGGQAVIGKRAYDRGVELYHDATILFHHVYALNCFRVAQPLAEAHYMLGYMYRHAESYSGITRHYPSARHYWELCSTQALAKCMNSLGTLYSNGQGVERDHATALHWFQKALARARATGDEETERLATNNIAITERNIAQQRRPPLASPSDTPKSAGIPVAFIPRQFADAELTGTTLYGEPWRPTGNCLGLKGQQALDQAKDYWAKPPDYRRNALRMVDCYFAARPLPRAHAGIAGLYSGTFTRTGDTPVDVNMAIAADYYYRCAIQEWAACMYSLSLLFTNGSGVRKNLHAAHYWAQKCVPIATSTGESFWFQELAPLCTELRNRLERSPETPSAKCYYRETDCRFERDGPDVKKICRREYVCP